MRDPRRRIRFMASALLLAAGGTALVSIGSSLGIARALSITLFLLYLVVSAGLMAVLTGRLFRQHQMNQLKFDIGAVLILTTLIAFPLGISSAFHQFADPMNPQISQSDLAGPVRITISILLYFLLLPNLFVTEAVLVWCVAWRTKAE